MKDEGWNVNEKKGWGMRGRTFSFYKKKACFLLATYHLSSLNCGGFSTRIFFRSSGAD